MKNFSNKWLFSLHTLLFHVNVFDATRSSASDVCISMCFECSSFYVCFRLFIIVIKPFSLKRMWKHEYIFYFSHPIVPPNYCTSTQVQLSCVDNDLLRVGFLKTGSALWWSWFHCICKYVGEHWCVQEALDQLSPFSQL